MGTVGKVARSIEGGKPGLGAASPSLLASRLGHRIPVPPTHATCLHPRACRELPRTFGLHPRRQMAAWLRLVTKRRRKDGGHEKADVSNRCAPRGSGHVARGERTSKNRG